MAVPRVRANSWATPRWLFDALHREFGFTVDAAAEAWNAKLPRFWSANDDGLAQAWDGERVFCNPPYGGGLVRWVSKAARSSGLSVLLVPARTETDWFHRFGLQAAEIRFVRGRIHFDRPPQVERSPAGSRPQWASLLLVFDPSKDGPTRVSSMAGRQMPLTR